MHFKNRSVLTAAIAGCMSVLVSGPAVWASDTDIAVGDDMAFQQTNLDANLAGNAEFTDANLLNAWGLAFAPGGAFWMNGNHSGTSNLIKGDGTVITGLVVTIPSPLGAVSAPTGIIANPTAQFFLPGTKLAAAFIFDTEDGTVAAWNPGVDATHAVIVADNSGSGAVYKGLAF